MLDTGSTCSLLLADVAENLGLDGPLETVLLNGIQKTSELLTKRINVQVSPVNDFGTQFDVNGVLVVDHLNVPEKKMKLQKLQERWPHLSDLVLTEVAGTQVTLLLGSDVAELIVPWKYDTVRRVLLLVFVLGLVGLLLVVYLVISKSKNLFVKFMWQLQTRSSMKP